MGLSGDNYKILFVIIESIVSTVGLTLGYCPLVNGIYTIEIKTHLTTILITCLYCAGGVIGNCTTSLKVQRLSRKRVGLKRNKPEAPSPFKRVMI
jgi:hypothetical protein